MTLSPIPSDVPPLPASSAPALHSGYRRGRWIMGLLLLTGLGSGFWGWMTRLNALERQFVGQWTTTEKYDDGSTVTRNWELRSDRTLHFRNQYHWTAAPGRLARNEHDDGEMAWSIRGGRLLVNPIHQIPKRLKVLAMLTRWRIRNAIQGTAGIVMDAEGSNGRLSAVEADSFTVTWWNPDKQVESSKVVYTRVRPDAKP